LQIIGNQEQVNLVQVEFKSTFAHGFLIQIRLASKWNVVIIYQSISLQILVNFGTPEVGFPNLQFWFSFPNEQCSPVANRTRATFKMPTEPTC
jgi:hypothetical protein